MAPESERANVAECVRCKDGECFLNRCPCTCHILNPQADPTLTCSEVVERLATECHFIPKDDWEVHFDTEKATAILHSWRERVRKEQLDEIRSDPASTVCGIPMPEIMKLIYERKENASAWRERRVQELPILEKFEDEIALHGGLGLTIGQLENLRAALVTAIGKASYPRKSDQEGREA